MLHILWMIIKGILLLLGILLGLILAVVFLILFCPVRYSAAVEKIEEDFKKTKLYISVSWLLHAVGVRIRMEEGNLSLKILMCGIPLDKFKRRKQKKKEVKKLSEEPKKIDTTEALSQKKEETKKESVKQNQEKKIPEEKTQEEKIPEKKTPKEKTQEISKQKEKAPSMIKKIGNMEEKLKRTVNWWKCFLGDEKVMAAISSVKKELWKILKHIFPKKLKGTIAFGSEDPSVTGAVLAVLGMTMPLHKNCVEITPLFDGTNTFQGTVSLKGRIYAVVLLVEGLKVILNKNIRYTIKYWKNKEES